MAQKNILFIMADQMTPFMMDAYGCSNVPLPNLTKLANRGIRFDAAYSSCPLCSPARASLMTGRYVSNIGAYDNGCMFASDEPTFAHYLTATGYDAALSGKMHFIGPDQLHGFSTRLTTDIYPSRSVWTSSFRVIHDGSERTMGRGFTDSYSFDPEKQSQKKYGVAPETHFLSYDDETQLRAKEYLRAAKTNEKPFFLCVSFHHPHEPFYVTPKMWEKWKNVDVPLPHFPDNMEESRSAMDQWTQYFHGADRFDVTNPTNILEVRRCYAALMEYVDTQIGDLLDTLENAGLAEDTIIAFTSDHGDMLCEKGMVQKRSFYEWSSRVPLIFAYPDNAYAGTVVQEPVSLVDLAPTFMELAQVTSNSHFTLDGESLVPLMQGISNPKRTVFSESHAEAVEAPCFMVRRENWKYIYITGHKGQLFDLNTDPNEWNNLIDHPAYASLIKEFKEILLAQFNPEQIEKDLDAKIRKAYFLQKSTRDTSTCWDYDPHIDESKRFVRTMD